MKKLRDFFYNASDIFVTLLVLALAAGIIFWRVQNVMAYSDYASAKKEPETKIDIDFTDVNLEPETDPAQEPETDPEQENEPEVPGEIGANYKSPREIQVVIPSGSSCTKVARYVAEALGYTDEESKNFVTMFTSTAKELQLASYLKSGTFTIPQGSTFGDMIKIIAKKK